MLTYNDCLGLSGLTPEQVAALVPGGQMVPPVGTRVGLGWDETALHALEAA